MGEVAALRQLVGQVQELWDLYGANAHPLPRQQNLPPSRPLGYYYSAALPPSASRSRSRPSSPAPRFARICLRRGLPGGVPREFACLASCFRLLIYRNRIGTSVCCSGEIRPRRSLASMFSTHAVSCDFVLHALYISDSLSPRICLHVLPTLLDLSVLPG